MRKNKIPSSRLRICLRRALILSFSLVIPAAVSPGCRRYAVQQPATEAVSLEHRQKEILMRVNRELVEEESGIIDSIAAHKGWQMQTSNSGLRYMIYRRGKGAKTITGKVVELAYTVALPDGTVCYSSEQSGTKTFLLGKGGVESGLEEGMLLMRVGDRARFIMPPHLAHGLSGDGNRIPRRAIIIYDVELLDMK